MYYGVCMYTQVHISNADITAPKQIFKISEEGMPVHDFASQSGDLYVTVTVVMPHSLNAEQRAIVNSAL